MDVKIKRTEEQKDILKVEKREGKKQSENASSSSRIIDFRKNSFLCRDDVGTQTVGNCRGGKKGIEIREDVIYKKKDTFSRKLFLFSFLCFVFGQCVWRQTGIMSSPLVFFLTFLLFVFVLRSVPFSCGLRGRIVWSLERSWTEEAYR